MRWLLRAEQKGTNAEGQAKSFNHTSNITQQFFVYIFQWMCTGYIMYPARYRVPIQIYLQSVRSAREIASTMTVAFNQLLLRGYRGCRD